MIGVKNVCVVVGVPRVLAPKIIVVFLSSLHVNFAAASERTQSGVNFGAKYRRNTSEQPRQFERETCVFNNTRGENTAIRSMMRSLTDNCNRAFISPRDESREIISRPRYPSTLCET